MNYLLGIEYNGNNLKISALKKSGKYFELFKLDSIFLSNEENEAIAQLAAWKGENLPNANSVKAVLTISESVLYIKELEIPKLNLPQLNEAVYWEIPSIAPISQAESVYDWRIVSEGKDTVNVLAIVGKSLYVENLISIFRKAMIDVTAIEPSAYAYGRICDAPLNNNTLLCFAQENGTNYIILKKGVPLFNTTTTANLQSGRGSRIKTAKDLTAELASGIAKVVDYWKSKESLEIQQIIVSGDVAYKYYGMDASINLLDKIPVVIGKNKKIKYFKTKDYKDLDIVGYLTSLGAAIRFMQKDVYEGINLFPASEKKKIEKERNQKKFTKSLLELLSVNLFLLVIIIASIFVLNIWWYSLEKQLDKAQKLSSGHPANNFIAETDATNLTIQNSIALTKQQEDMGDKLRLIAGYTPQSVIIKAINMQNTKGEIWTIDGIGDRAGILAFYEMLSQNIKATEISMPYSNFNKEKDNDFSVIIIW
jgi:hypothetical protein